MNSLLEVIAWEELNGFQTKRIRRRLKDVPAWVLNTKQLYRVIYSHPQAAKLAARWTAVAYWYWRLGMSADHIAEELQISRKAVELIISRLRKRGYRLDILPKAKTTMTQHARPA